MKPLFLTIICALLTQFSFSQTVSAEFSPKEKFKFVLIYKVKEIGQDYILNAKVKDGQMSFTMPADAEKGVYRLVYQIPQDKYNFDFIYDNQDVTFNFDAKKGITYTVSDINQFYYEFLKENNRNGNAIASLIRKGEDEALKKYLDKTKTQQDEAISKAKGTLVEEFVNNRLIELPKFNSDRQLMWQNYKSAFLGNLDFNSASIRSSKILYDKCATFLRMGFDERHSEGNINEVNGNVDVLLAKIDQWDSKLKKHFLHQMWKKLAKKSTEKSAIYLANKYLKPLAEQQKDEYLVAELNAYVNLAVGKMAPEIEWDENSKKQTLSNQTGFEHYVLVFWSSSCSHCQKQMPQLQDYLKEDKNTKVIAVGLESNDHRWKEFITKLPDFTHALALGKWKNPLVKTYNIQATPTYYILDSEKKIEAKPTGFKSFKKLYSDLKEKDKS